MESSPGEVDGNTDELTGRKKSRFKLLKTRLFGRLKKKGTEGQIKQSQSTSDITTQQGKRCEDDSEDESHYPQGTLCSRALSHDSIFLADQVQPSGPARVLSQENVHSKIKALQMKLQEQNMRLGPPPMLIPTKRIEDSGTTSEDDGLPCSPPEMSLQEGAVHGPAVKDPEAKKPLSLLSLLGTGSEEEEQGSPSQPPSRPLSPVSRLSPQAIASTTDITPPSPGVDFSSPALYVPSLDNSAAHHRMSIKPRNQRASTKGRKQQADVYRIRSNSMNNLDQPFSVSEESEETSLPDTSIETVSYSSSLCQVTNQADELILPVLPNIPLQDGSEGSAKGEETQNHGEPFLKECKDDTNILQSTSSVPLHPAKATSHVDSQCSSDIVCDDKEILQPKSSSEHLTSCPVLGPDAVTDHMVKIEDTRVSVAPEITDQEDASKKHVDADEPKLVEPLARVRPLPAPRTKKQTLDISNTSAMKICNTKPPECEKEAQAPDTISKNLVPCEGSDESSREGNILQRPSSFRFSISSAKYRSAVSVEHVTKKDEESSSNSVFPKTQTRNLELQTEKTDTTKPIEGSGNAIQAQDKKVTLQKEAIIQNTSKTEAVKNSGQGNNDKGEGAEDRRGLFGVKLRSTSLSLKYRSDVAKSEVVAKRHSLESHMLEVSEAPVEKEQSFKGTEEVTTDMKANVLPNLTRQYCDTQQDPTFESDKEPSPRPLPDSHKEGDTGSEPSWMILAREKCRAHQPSSTKSPIQPDPPTSSILDTPTMPNQQTPRPKPQPRPHLGTRKPQLRTYLSTDQSSQQTLPKPAPRQMLEKQASSDCRAEKSAADPLTSKAEQVDAKGSSKSEAKCDTQTEPDVLRRTNTLSTTKPEPLSPSTSSPLCHQQTASNRTEPSWMELAKRKSLAWSDKSMD